MYMRLLLVLSCLGMTAACGDDSPSGEAAIVEAPWETLVEGSWSLEPGTEGYVCARKTIEEDLWVRAFDAVAPLGTHHTVLTYGPPTEPDGVSPCDTSVNHDVMIFGSGVGSIPFEMPEGVAAHVPKGQQLLLNLHLFNVSSDPLTGSSAIRFQRVASGDDDFIVAEAVLMGPTDLQIPPGDHSESGTCTLTKDATIFAVAPHMHQLGVHMKVVAHSSEAGAKTLLDAPYSFDAQQITSLEPVPMRAGDTVSIRCDYRNDTPETVEWGESSLAEMCFAGVYRYPRDPEGFFVCFD
jgi:hypothetical protein